MRSPEAGRIFSALALILTACSHVSAPKPDPSGASHRSAQVQTQINTLGAGLFRVAKIQLAPERTATFTDDFDYATHFFVVPFEADIMFSKPAHIPTRNELNDALGKPDWNLEQTETGMQLEALFGPSDHLAGSTVHVSAAAYFLNLEPGWRFHTIGRLR